MKITICMKCPDALETIQDQVRNEVSYIIDPSEREEAFTYLLNRCNKIARKWFKWAECIEVIIDTEDETCVVKEL